jgi:hypothetical protein
VRRCLQQREDQTPDDYEEPGLVVSAEVGAHDAGVRTGGRDARAGKAAGRFPLVALALPPMAESVRANLLFGFGEEGARSLVRSDPIAAASYHPFATVATVSRRCGQAC